MSDSDSLPAVGKRVARSMDPEVEFVLVGKHHGRDSSLQVLAYLGENEDPKRIFDSRRRTYSDVHWARQTSTFERVTLEDVQRERDQ